MGSMGSQVTTPDDGTRGMTLRELVLEVRADVKGVGAKVDTHLLEHAQWKGQRTGEARVLGVGRSALALSISVGGFLLSVAVAAAKQ
jgi:hypothetical protein